MQCSHILLEQYNYSTYYGRGDKIVYNLHIIYLCGKKVGLHPINL